MSTRCDQRDRGEAGNSDKAQFAHHAAQFRNAGNALRTGAGRRGCDSGDGDVEDGKAGGGQPASRGAAGIVAPGGISAASRASNGPAVIRQTSTHSTPRYATGTKILFPY